MAYSTMERRRFSAAIMLGVVLATSTIRTQAQGAGASEQDKHFLKNTEQDSNFEIKTGQLALSKSSSGDVKSYATMVIHDHTQLKGQLKSAETAARVTAGSSTSMSTDDTAMYLKLKVLSGNSFDQAYIKELVKGNQEGLDEAKSEASASTLPAVKQLAEKRVSLDSKHLEKAKQLAGAHGVQAQ